MPDLFNSPNTGRMPDSAPRDWSAAFAALPLEAPPGDGWSRIAHSLEAPKRHGHRAHRERRTSWLVGLASAAVVVMAAWSPLSHWLQDAPATTTAPAVAVTAATGVHNTPAATTPSSTSPDARVAIDTAIQPAPASRSGRNGAAVPAPQASRASAVRKTVASAVSARVQAAQGQPQEVPPNTYVNVATTAPAADAIHNLQAQSARLEALVAIARDERVGNASGELLSAELDAGIAAVDASLSQDDVEDSRRQQLWQQRVDLLQQLAGVESTARWLAAQGMSNETALVSVD